MKGGEEEKWKKAIFWVFDAPEIAHKPFEVTVTQKCFTNFLGTN
jgi:hypothetical protein